jgi:hypothetical protein
VPVFLELDEQLLACPLDVGLADSELVGDYMLCGRAS